MEAVAIIVALVLGFLVLKFISGMIKFAVLALIIFGVFLFMTGGIGA